MRTPFDEVFDAGGGLRPAYQRLAQGALNPPPEVVERLRERPLGDDVGILPVPLALEQADLDAVRAGVAQRALALQAFLGDVLLGDRAFLASGHGPGPSLIGEILACAGLSLDGLCALWRGHGLDDLCFVYGPDLARRPDGCWVVLEDNVGCVGGTADAFFVADAYARATGLAAPTRDTADLTRAVRRWLASHRGRTPAALVGCDALGVRESARRGQLLDDLGIKPVAEAELNGQGGDSRAVVNFGSLADHTVFDRVPLLNAPGTEVLGNKALLPFVDDMVRFFHAEEPLIPTPETGILRDEPPPRGWVVKTSTGAGGAGVMLSVDGATETIRALVGASGPAGVVAQRRVEPSRLLSRRIELRPIAYVIGRGEVLVGEQLLAKAVPESSSLRPNNVSRGAAYVPVLGKT